MPGWAWAVVAGLSFGFSQLSNRGLNRQSHALNATTAMLTALLGFLIVAIVAVEDISALWEIDGEAVLWFAAAGITHFFAGWTVFAFSQQQIGPSRTAAILSVNPVLAAVAAWIVLSEGLRTVTWIGVLAVTAGVAVVSMARLGGGDWANPALALGATVCFSVSPLFVRLGLEEFNHPLLGLAIGLGVTVPVMHLATRMVTKRWVSVPPGHRRWLLSGGSLAALAVTAQWTAFALIPVGVSISLQQLSTPTVILIGPVLLATPSEKATPRLVYGSALIVLGSILVALFGRTV